MTGGFPPLAAFADGPARPGPLRVGLVTPEVGGLVRTGGVGTAYALLARALARAGHRVTVLDASGTYAGGPADWLAAYQALGITVEPLPTPPGPPPDGSLPRRRAWAVYTWLRDRPEPFDVVHAPDWQGTLYYALLARRQGLGFAGTLFCVGMHGPTLWAKEGNGQFVETLDDVESDFMERRAAAWADVVISPTQYLPAWLAARGWTFPARTAVQPNLLDLADLPPAGGPDPRPVAELVFFGRLEPRKGLDVFCDAVDRLYRTAGVPPFRVTFLGRALDLPQFSTRAFLAARAAQWPEPPTLLDDLDRRAALAYLAGPGRLAVVGSAVDNAPYTVLECLAAGIPLVATDRGGIPELVDPADRVRVLVPPEPAPLAARLAAALSAGWAPARPAFDPAANEAAWLAFHHRLPRPASPRPPAARPPVSVVLVHHDRPRHLERALASLRAQDYPAFEVVLVDDGSETPEAHRALEDLAPEFAARGWTLLREPNRYLGAARNRGAARARGDFLLFMDDDNVAEPEEISTFVRAALASGADILTAVMDVFRDEAPEAPVRRFVPLGGDAAAGLFENAFGDANALVRTAVFRALGGFTEEVGVGHEDWEFFARAVLAGYTLEVVPVPLFRYRESADSMVRATLRGRNHWRSARPYLAAVPPALGPLVLFAQGHYLDRLYRPPDPGPPDLLPTLRAALEAYRGSTSWRITEPFRRLGRRSSAAETAEPADAQAAWAALEALRQSAWWELTGPLRVLARWLRRRR
ncbi:MAG: glycosyltransferase [Actinomycetia bacterium]|nr:glycosyltransferase [Actinomycetes bacterium]